MTWQIPDTSYWENKFAAYWHDPIDKVISIQNHEERAADYLQIFGIDRPNDEFWQMADAIAAGFERGQVPSHSTDDTKNGAVDFAESPVITHPTTGKKGLLKITGVKMHINDLHAAIMEFLENILEKKQEMAIMQIVLRVITHDLPLPGFSIPISFCVLSLLKRTSADLAHFGTASLLIPGFPTIPSGSTTRCVPPSVPVLNLAVEQKKSVSWYFPLHRFKDLSLVPERCAIIGQVLFSCPGWPLKGFAG